MTIHISGPICVTSTTLPTAVTDTDRVSEAVARLRDDIAGGGTAFEELHADLRTVLSELERLHNDRQTAVNAFALMADTCNRLLEAHGNKGRHDQSDRLRSAPPLPEIEDALLNLEMRAEAVGEHMNLLGSPEHNAMVKERIEAKRIVREMFTLRSAPKFTEADMKILNHVIAEAQYKSPWYSEYVPELTDLASRIEKHIALQGEK